jgi:hypothetical protein
VFAAVDQERLMTPAQFELLNEEDAGSLLLWRFHKLSEAGHEPLGALILAARLNLDLQLASDLLATARERRQLVA